MQRPTIPILHVRPKSANRLLEIGGHSVAELRALLSELQASGSERGWRTVPMEIRVHARVQLSEPQELTGYNVLAILPGSDTALDEEALLVSTHYDMPIPDPDSAFLAASDGPAGVGIMLEMARLWQAAEFKPRRSILFSVWAGGYLSVSGAEAYQRGPVPYKSLRQTAVLHLGSVGNGDERLLLSTDDNGTVSLLRRRSDVLGVPVQQTDMLSHAYCREIATRSTIVAWRSAPDPFHGGDTLEDLSLKRLRQVGEIVNLALITASRQYHY